MREEVGIGAREGSVSLPQVGRLGKSVGHGWVTRVRLDGRQSAGLVASVLLN